MAASGRLYHTLCHQNCNVKSIVVDNWERLVEIYTYQTNITWRLLHGRVSLPRRTAVTPLQIKGLHNFLITLYHQLR